MLPQSGQETLVWTRHYHATHILSETYRASLIVASKDSHLVCFQTSELHKSSANYLELVTSRYCSGEFCPWNLQSGTAFGVRKPYNRCFRYFECLCWCWSPNLLKLLLPPKRFPSTSKLAARQQAWWSQDSLRHFFYVVVVEEHTARDDRCKASYQFISENRLTLSFCPKAIPPPIRNVANLLSIQSRRMWAE